MRKAAVLAAVLLLNMRRPVLPDPYVDPQLLGILLAGMLGQTRPECSVEARLELELRPSGVHRIALPEPGEPEH